MFAVGPEPVRRPVQRAQVRARGDARIGRDERALPDAVGDERPDAAFVAIPLGDDQRAKPSGEGVHFEVGSGSLDFVEQAEDVPFGELPQAIGQRTVTAARLGERGQQFLERPVLAEVEQFVLAAEVVIEVGRGQVGGDGDVAHAGGREAACAEDAGRRLEDADPPGVGPTRTTVRKLNHRSILQPNPAVRKSCVASACPAVHNRKVRGWKWLVAGATVVGVVGALQLASVDHAAVAAPLLLLDVVVVARLFGFGPALLTAGLGAAAYSYFFLPPEGFGLESPDDWIAFVTFTVTAVLAGELASRAERRAAEAQAGRLEIERLYQELRSAFERASEAEAARRNEALKAALLDALTHNLRTPLTAIKAAVTALIRSGVPGEPELPSEGRVELLLVINEETDRLNRFIEGLSTSDARERSQPAHSRMESLDAILRTGLMRAETVTRDHRVVVETDRDLPPVSVDPAAMTEVIYILLDNASKYAPRASRIAVRASRADEANVRIAVADEGPGIPEELRERVFEKFFRVPAREPLDPRRAGAGLGLPIARRLVDAQGGRIWVEAPPLGHGTVVVVLLPAAAVETIAATPQAAPAMTVH